MKRTAIGSVLAAASAVLTATAHAEFAPTTLQTGAGDPAIELVRLGTYEGNLSDGSSAACDALGGVDESVVFGAAEIVAYDTKFARLAITHNEVVEGVCADEAETGFSQAVFTGIDIVSVTNPREPRLIRRIDTSALGQPTSVAICAQGGFYAAALAPDPGFAPGTGAPIRGKVAFYGRKNGRLLNSVEVGFLPDMITCTPDSRALLVANEGEPSSDYASDPPGSVSVIDVSDGPRNAMVREATFDAFNSELASLIASGVRIFGPGASVAQDLEPEYIAVSEDSATAFVTLQENNAVATVDIATATVTGILPLGYKDHSLLVEADGPAQPAMNYGLDPSNRDGGAIIRPWPVMGMYQPDSIAAFQAGGQTYFMTANEGDARDYDGFSEEARIGDAGDDLPELCEGIFPDEILEDENLGRLLTTNSPPFTASGEVIACLDTLYAYGARSFSIWTAEGEQVADTGNQLELITATALPNNFNATDDEDNFDNRSDDKGPEPEGLTVGEVDGRLYAFGLLERIGGVVVYDITDPAAPLFIQYINNRSFDGQGDFAPEGVVFVPRSQSRGPYPFIAVANEVSGTTTLYAIMTH